MVEVRGQASALISATFGAERVGRPDRLRLRPERTILDACLSALEDAHERGEVSLSTALHSRLAAHIPGLVSGMRIGEALDLVFRQQEARHTTRTRSRTPSAPATEGQARDLTSRIKAAAQNVSVLLLEAHQKRVWLPLGYRSWEQYIRTEFGMSRSRSYELLDHGRVLEAIRAAADISDFSELPAYHVQLVRPRLAELNNAISYRLKPDMCRTEIAEVITEIVNGLKERVREDKRSASLRNRVLGINRTDRAVQGEQDAIGVEGQAPEDLCRLYDLVAYLASMPQPCEVIAQIPERDSDRLRDVNRAARWLAQFSIAWHRQRNDFRAPDQREESRSELCESDSVETQPFPADAGRS